MIFIFLKEVFKSEHKFSREDKLDWSQKINVINVSKKDLRLVFPVIKIDYWTKWDFEVFNSSEKIIEYSIDQHWGLNDYIENKNNKQYIQKSNIIDSTGQFFNLNHDCFNKEANLGFSYPDKLLGYRDLNKFKKQLIEGYKEYFQVFGIDNQEDKLKMLITLEEMATFKEVIKFIDTYLDFGKL